MSKIDPFTVSRDDIEEVAPRKRGMTPYRATFVAGVPQRNPFDGDYFHVLTAPVDDLIVRFDDGEPVEVYKGVGFRRYYKSVTLESATGQSVVVLVGYGSVADARAAANVNVAATVEPGNTGDDGGDVVCTAGAATQLLAQDTTRLYAYIVNPSTNTVTVRVGTSSVNASSGIPVEPGSTLPYPSTSALYAWNPDASDVTISAGAVKRV